MFLLEQLCYMHKLSLHHRWTHLSRFSGLFVAPMTMTPSPDENLSHINMHQNTTNLITTYMILGIANYNTVFRSWQTPSDMVSHPSISASSWLMVWLAYGWNVLLVRFPPTLSISSINITLGATFFASAATNQVKHSDCNVACNTSWSIDKFPTS